jgi:hypothetical protein
VARWRYQVGDIVRFWTPDPDLDRHLDPIMGTAVVKNYGSEGFPWLRLKDYSGDEFTRHQIAVDPATEEEIATWMLRELGR